MRNSVSVSLPNGIFKQLKTESRRESASNSEVVRKALREYFFRTEFTRLRAKAMIEAAKKGINLTEKEIFEQIS